MKQNAIVIGIVAILCVAACIALLDSISSFQGPTSNSSSSNTTPHITTGTPAKATTNVTAKATTKVTAKVTTKASTNVTAKATTKATTAVPAKTTTTQAAYTTTQIYQHLTNIAFGPDNPRIEKVSSTSEKVSISGSYTDDDKADLEAFRQQFNTLSSTTKISELSEGDQGNIIINILPEDSLDGLATDSSYNTIYGKQTVTRDDAGTICSIYRTITYMSTASNMVYVNGDLKGDKREHYMLRGLLYYLGFLGESGTYKDSMFYSEPNANANLSTIDIKAVQLMYGSKITNGMTVSQIEGLY